VLPEFGPLSAYDSSGTLLYQLNGSNTPGGSFGDVCVTAVDSGGNVYGTTLLSLCVASNSSHGSIKIGTLPPTPTGNSNLQGGSWRT
jgi:hypothetical protein